MKKLLILLVVVLAGLLVHRYFYKTPRDQWFRLRSAGKSGSQAFVRRIPAKGKYGVQINAFHDAIFAPLDGVTQNPTAEIQKSRGLALAERAQGNGQDECLELVIAICMELSVANRVREAYAAQLRDARTKVRYSMRRTPSERKKAEEQERKFFEAAILRNWDEYATGTRRRLELLLIRLHALEKGQDLRYAG